MERTLKLQRLITGFSNFDSGLGGAFKSISPEIKKVMEKLQEEAKAQTVKNYDKQIKEIKNQIQTILELIGNTKEELTQNEKELSDSLSGYFDKELTSSKSTFDKKLTLLKSTLEKINATDIDHIELLSGDINRLKKDIKEISNRKIEFPDFTPQINAVESELKDEIVKLQSKLREIDKQEAKDLEDKLNEFEKELIDIRKRTLGQSLGGGQANRNILVAGNSSTLSRYTDLNIKAGGGVTLTHTNNDTLKTTDLTIASPGGATAVYGEILTGSGTSWTLAHTPVGDIALYVQGTRISVNRGDFTIVGTAVTTAVSYTAGDLEADYSY